MTSSNIASVGYDPATEALEVEFKNGGVFTYAGVKPDTHRKLLAAKSVGGFFHQHIRGVCACTKGGSDEPR